METKTFIVIERDELDRFVAERMLRFLLVKHVMTFRSLSEALEFLGRQTEINGVALIGLQMLVNDEWNFMDAVHKLENAAKHVDVYLLATTVLNSVETQAMRYPNFKGFIEKPITVEKIKDRVLTFI